MMGNYISISLTGSCVICMRMTHPTYTTSMGRPGIKESWIKLKARKAVIEEDRVLDTFKAPSKSRMARLFRRT